MKLGGGAGNRTWVRVTCGALIWPGFALIRARTTSDDSTQFRPLPDQSVDLGARSGARGSLWRWSTEALCAASLLARADATVGAVEARWRAPGRIWFEPDPSTVVVSYLAALVGVGEPSGRAGWTGADTPSGPGSRPNAHGGGAFVFAFTKSFPLAGQSFVAHPDQTHGSSPPSTRLAEARKGEARAQEEADSVRMLHDFLRASREEAQTRFLAPLSTEVQRLARQLDPTSKIALDPAYGVHLERDVFGSHGFDDLGGGCKVQVAILVRLAMASILAGDGVLPVLFDDLLEPVPDISAQAETVARLFEVAPPEVQHGVLLILGACAQPRDEKSG
jgi:hypothetical protein